MNRIFRVIPSELKSILWAVTNVIFFLLMWHFDRQPDGDFYAEVFKKVFLISFIMQVLYVVGFIKQEKN